MLQYSGISFALASILASFTFTSHLNIFATDMDLELRTPGTFPLLEIGIPQLEKRIYISTLKKNLMKFYQSYVDDLSTTMSKIFCLKSITGQSSRLKVEEQEESESPFSNQIHH